jgi:hypothetical protein
MTLIEQLLCRSQRVQTEFLPSGHGCLAGRVNRLYHYTTAKIPRQRRSET